MIPADLRLPDPERSRAVIIGISAYASDALQNHPKIKKNVIDLYEVLTDPGQGTFLEEHCELVLDESNLQSLGEKLHTAAAEATDLLLVYYAGHGLLGGLHHGLHLSVTSTNPKQLPYTALPFANVRETFLGSAAASRVVILDCCYSGRAINQTLSGGRSEVIAKVEINGTYTLTSAARHEEAIALPGERHTAFTGRLLRLLTEDALVASEPLSLGRIYESLRRTTTAEGLPSPEQCGTGNAERLALVRPLPPGHARARTPESLLRDAQTHADAVREQARKNAESLLARADNEAARRRMSLSTALSDAERQRIALQAEVVQLAAQRDRLKADGVSPSTEYSEDIRARAKAAIRDAGVLRSVNGILDEALAFDQAKRAEAEAHYEDIRASAAAAATDFETKLARRREQCERDIAARQAKAEQVLSGLNERSLGLQDEIDKALAAAELNARNIRAEAAKDAAAKRAEAEAHYEDIRASAAAAATDFETKLAARRERFERDLAARQAKAE